MSVQVKIPKDKPHAGKLCWVSDRECTKKKCFRPHDCGYRNSTGKWIQDITCVTRYNNGCPD